MKFTQLQPLILHNLQRCFKSNGIAFDYFDEQELDDSLTHSENLSNVLSSRGIRTRDEHRMLLKRYAGMQDEYESELIA